MSYHMIIESVIPPLAFMSCSNWPESGRKHKEHTGRENQWKQSKV